MSAPDQKDVNNKHDYSWLYSWLYSHLAITVYTVVVVYLVVHYGGELIFDSILHLFLSFLVGAVTYFLLTIKQIKLDNKNTYKLIVEENEKVHGQIVKDNREMNEKMHRNLIKTNAVIPDENKKLAITAQISGFYDVEEYKVADDEKKYTNTIDLIRYYSYQNLIFTPEYIRYLFYRVEHSKEGGNTRIVVIDEVCQAAITYVLLSIRAGYKTYILHNDTFKRFARDRCNEELRKIIKGNPFMLKIEKNNGTELRVKYDGKYSNFRDNRNTVTIEEKNHEQTWNLLDQLISNSEEFKDASDVYNIDKFSAILNYNKSKNI